MSFILKEGSVFSGCRILSRCGKGAFGITYLARTPLDEKIIIKMVSSPAGAEKELRGVRSYMQIAGQHPNLLKIFHTGVTDEGFFYTMEAADNCGSEEEYAPATLSNLLKKYRSFTPEEALRIIRELLEAVKIMHAAGLIHRDIKPENIIFVNGRPKLSDPGLVTEAGKTVSFAGTFGFVPPECFNGSVPISENGDLYALGMVFYTMVTGFPPKDYPRIPLDMRIEAARQITPPLYQMCNRNPAKRFKSADEFLKGLPEKLENPTPFEKLRERFRAWRCCNREKMRRITFFTAALLLLALGAGAFFLHRLEQKHRLEETRKAQVASFKAREGDRAGLLALQLEVFAPELFKEYSRLKKIIGSSAAAGKWASAAKAVQELEKKLAEGAAEKLKAMIRKADLKPEGKEGFALSGAFHGYLSTPLALFAPPRTLARCRQKIALVERSIYSQWQGPRCGREWNSMQDYDKNLVFMPPGALRMKHSKKIEKIPYHYWIGKYEVTGESFSTLMGIAPRRSSVAQTPVERVCWNDMLFYCRNAWKKMRDRGVIPPGYILRPPTEAEWEFAARNGWQGEDTTPLEERAVLKNNSRNRTRPVGSLEPARSGIFDIYGNVSELVIPREVTDPQFPFVIRGGSFNTRPEKYDVRTPYLANQAIPHTVGFRFVLAPGDGSFYDKHFFLGGAPWQVRHKGKIFEVTGGVLGAFTWPQAEKFARLLGGRLAEFEDLEEMKYVTQKLPLIKQWPAHVGIKKAGSKWQFLSSGKPVQFGRFRKFTAPGTPLYAACVNNSWYPLDHLTLPLFICQWNAEDYPRRNRRLEAGKKLPLELGRFSWGKREFILIDSQIHWIGAKRVCELLGGRLAVLESEVLRKKAVKELEKFSSRRILLGGYAKRNKWFFLDGSEISFPLKKDPRVDIPGRNRNFLTLQGGNFYNSLYSDSFLFERPRSSVSSSSR